MIKEFDSEISVNEIIIFLAVYIICITFFNLVTILFECLYTPLVQISQ